MADGNTSEIQEAAFVVVLARAEWVPLELTAETTQDGIEDYCVCLLERHENAAQLAGCSVFPGAQLDSMDSAIAEGHDSALNLYSSLALRIAAVRAVFAETGAVLLEPPPPGFLRQPTREILRRDGPRTFLDCMIAWDGGNPSPELTLCPFENFAVLRTSDQRLDAASELNSHFFISEVPDAEELAWMQVAKGDNRNVSLLWMKPSEILRASQTGRIKLPFPEHFIITTLHQRLPRLDGLPSLLSGGLIVPDQASKL